MKKTIWKYMLKVDDAQIIAMPANAHILTVQVQFGDPCLWALVSPQMPLEGRRILIAGTGHEREDINGLTNYIGSFQLAGGALVFHVFEDVLHAAVADSTEVAAAVQA